jgi:hypothetical protein
MTTIEKRIAREHGRNGLMRYWSGQAIANLDRKVSTFFNLDTEQRVGFYKTLVVMMLICAGVLNHWDLIIQFVWGLSDVISNSIS